MESKNVIIGAAGVYISATDSTSATWTGAPALSTPTTTYEAALDADNKWRSVGFTKDGVEVQYAPTYGEVEVDQLLDAAKLFRQTLKVTVLTNMVEATLENLLVAWGQQSNSLTDDGAGNRTMDILPGGLGDEPIERAVAFVGKSPKFADAAKNPNNKPSERVYYVTRAIVDNSTNHMLRRNEATTFPVSFRLLPDTTQSNNRYGQIKDRLTS